MNEWVFCVSVTVDISGSVCVRVFKDQCGCFGVNN